MLGRASGPYLITGAAGFIGSHLAESLVSSGSEVFGIDELSTGNLNNIAHLIGHRKFHFARASITDGLVMDRLASDADVIIHLAAAVGVKLIVDHPVHTIETNITGTEAVLKTALRYRCRVLIASTSEVYGKGSKVPFSEDDDVVLGATNKSRWAYAASKMVDEFLGLAYLREKGLEVVVMRLFNTVGPRQTGRYGMVVPRFIHQAMQGEPMTVYGDGMQSRCFCAVQDVVKAIVGLARNPDSPGRVYNIGATEEITMGQLAERVKIVTASRSPIINIPYAQAYAPGFEDMRRRVPNIERIRSLIGWQPEKSLNEILKSILDYEQTRPRQPELGATRTVSMPA